MVTADMIKQKARQYGADLCGIAPADSFSEAPAGFRPHDIYPRCRAVVVFAARFPHAALQAPTQAPYTFVRNMMVDKMDRITFGLVDDLDRRDIGVVPIPASEPYDYWDAERKHGRAILSLKHAGQLAGLGRIGKNTLLVNDQYGNMIWLGAVLADADLAPDPPAAYTVCPPKCRICLDACPQQALDGVTIDQKLCRRHSGVCTDGGGWILSCNLCRKMCPRHKGIDRKKHSAP